MAKYSPQNVTVALLGQLFIFRIIFQPGGYPLIYQPPECILNSRRIACNSLKFKEGFSNECPSSCLRRFCFTTLCDWLKLAFLSQLISSKTKTNPNLLVRISRT